MATFVFLITILFFIVGIAGCFLPIVPGNLIVWLGVIVHKLSLGDDSVSWTFVLVATALTAAAQILDFLCSYWGARRFGASWQGAIGAVAGAVLGLAFFSIPGLILGPVAGAVLVELVKGANWRRARRAGIGTVVGGIAAFVLKIAAAAAVIAGFVWALPQA